MLTLSLELKACIPAYVEVHIMMKWPERYGNGVTMTSHGRHVVSNHRSFECLIISLGGPTSKKHESTHYWPFVRGIHQWPAKSPQKSQLQLTRKKTIWRRHHCVIWIRDKMGNTYNYLLLHSYHSIKYIISIRELLNHNCCVKSSSQIRASQVLHQNLPRARRLIGLGGKISGGCRTSVSFKEAIVGSVGITPTCFFRMPCWLSNDDTSKFAG